MAIDDTDREMVTISPESGLKRLKEKFNAEIGEGKKYWRARPATLSPEPTWDAAQMTALDEVTKEAGKAIYLSPSDFEHLCVVLSFNEADSSPRQYREYFDMITYERRIREDNPGVQAAWEAYQIMLQLARPNSD